MTNARIVSPLGIRRIFIGSDEEGREDRTGSINRRGTDSSRSPRVEDRVTGACVGLSVLQKGELPEAGRDA
jgi:hypothetical protein